jgi:hypothetical protein
MGRHGNRAGVGSPYPEREVEYMFAAMMIGWGSWLLVPFWDTFSNPAYQGLKDIAPESIWGVFSLVTGVVRWTVLKINGSYCRTPLLRFICALLGVNWWAALMWLFFVSPIPNPPAGYVFYPVFLWYELRSCRRSMADAFRQNSFRPIQLPRILAMRRTADVGQ